ncbi:MAG: tyrosine-type recombinase/integrase [Candidatus Omnitrophica bacterium]|nr:tyrosine-type recombinase/integrase [Candidatus Omnitrophota bacterium]
MKIQDAFQEFINYSLLERCLEPTTINWYKRSMNPFCRYLRYKVIKSDIESLTTLNLRGFFVSQRVNGNSPRTIINSMQGIKSFCSFLVKRGYLSKNPFEGLEKPKLTRRLPEFLDEEEARDLMRVCLDMPKYYKSRWSRNVAILALFLFTGIRKKELLSLKLGDLNLERGYIRVFAKNKERLIPLNETVKEYLADYLKLRPKRSGVDNIFVSTNRKASALTGQGINILFKELRAKIKFKKKLSPQILRHTFCTLMLRNGVNLRDIQLLAGHSDISTTARFYLGCDDKQLKQAVDRHPLNI